MENVNKGYKAVIYDCDGVMFDSMQANFAFYGTVMDHMGLALDWNDPEVIRVIHTYANREVMNHFFVDRELREEAVRFAGTIDYRRLIPLMKMEEGFRATLEELQKKVSLAVCTNRSTSMEAVLEGFELESYFSFVMTAARSTRIRNRCSEFLIITASCPVKRCSSVIRQWIARRRQQRPCRSSPIKPICCRRLPGLTGTKRLFPWCYNFSRRAAASEKPGRALTISLKRRLAASLSPAMS
jgi:hypothetical protein